jgi:hypothetical protein
MPAVITIGTMRKPRSGAMLARLARILGVLLPSHLNFMLSDPMYSGCDPTRVDRRRMLDDPHDNLRRQRAS